MADIPKDPRQLARDILSGKISIEELKRQQEQRAGRAAPPQAPRQADVPDRVPLPRTAQRQQQTPVTSEARVPLPTQVPNRAPQAPSPPPPQPAPRPQQRQPQRPTARVERPKRTEPARPVEITLPPPPPPISQQPSPVSAALKPTASRKMSGNALRQMLRNKQNVRAGIVLSEILGKPLGLRD